MVGARHLSALALVVGLPAFLSSAPTAQTSYDMWDYMTNDYGTTQYLTGGHTMKTFTRSSPTDHLILIKGTSGYPFEVWELIGGNIFTKYESGIRGCSGTSTWARDDYRFYDSGDYLWSPQMVQHNDIFYTSDFRIYYNYLDGGTEMKKYFDFASYPIRVEVISSMSLGGDLGMRSDIIAMHHYWKTNDYTDDDEKEVYYYDREYGLVKWENIDPGGTQSSLFNVIQSGSFGEDGPWPSSTEGYTAC